jgi:hypothetical protein
MHTEVRLRYDDGGEYAALVGSYLQTASRTTYFVTRAKRGPSGTWSVIALRWPPDDIPRDVATVLPLFWNPRKGKRH